MVLAGRDVMREPLERRRALLEQRVLPKLSYPIRYSAPQEKSGRWGQGRTQAKMADVQWLKSVLVDQFEFLEWTPDDHLRHSTFVGLREDKDARGVRRE